MIQMTCEAILFDLDGVLVDSTAGIVRHWTAWAQLHELDATRIMQVAHGRRIVETIRLVAPHLSAEEEARRLSEVEASDLEGITAFAGAADLIAALPARAWAIATAGSREIATARLLRAGLRVPDVLVNADDVTKGKPDPESYLLAAHKLGVAPNRCIVIEDAPFGVEAGRSAGARTIAVASTHDRKSLARADIITGRLANIRAEARDGAGLLVSVDP